MTKAMLFRVFIPILLVFSAAPFAEDTRAADWPMWRYDAGRTAVSPGPLPTQLHLQWVRQLPPPRPAWPKNIRKMRFDVSYEPVVMGKTIFVPSMVSDHLAAFDTETSEEKWRFYADGPVRFAPVAWKGKVFFVSDDGYLYCLDAADGSLLWKFRGGPSDRRILGNDRLISAWPARGAPVIRDGTIYFAAGIWPFMGTFIHALDAETGKVVWTNSGSGSIYVRQQHHSDAFAGVAPQGYLTATEKELLVSGGRTVPAGYDRATGKFLHFNVSDRSFGKDAGGYRVIASRGWYFNGAAAYRAADGNGLLRAGALVVANGMILSVDGSGNILANAQRLEREEYVDRKGKKQTRSFLPKLWQASTEPVITRLFLEAGPRLYGSGKDGLIAAVDLPRADGKANTSWQGHVEGDVWSMIAADRKLFVVTRQGSVYCFGARRTEPKRFAPAVDNPGQTTKDEWTTTARAILDQTDQREGYCLVLGADTGRLAEELVRQSDLNVIALDPNTEKVEQLRRRLDHTGLYGTRISVHAGDVASVELPPYFANLVVAEDLEATGIGTGSAFVEKAFHSLRPYSGTICFDVTAKQRATLVRRIEAADLANAELNARSESLVTLTRVGALPGSANWTHNYGDAANSVVSRDTVPRAPLGLLWFGGPSNENILPRHGHGPAPHVVDGRLFIEGPNLLRAVDVYTGRLLWEREIKNVGKFYDNTGHQPGAGEIGSNYVSLPDGIYVMTPRQCLRLDPATGETVKQFRLPARTGGKPPRWGFLTAEDDLLVATTAPITVSTKDDKKKPSRKLEPIVKKNSKWQYLAGSHPKDGWTQVGFAPSNRWKTGMAGFGYSDNDDKTVLKDMQGKYTAVYLRRTFDVADLTKVPRLGLMINYDDAFIAYLNDQEVLRVGVGRGNGANAASVAGHEADGHQLFEIKDHARLLRKGPNVLAIEGHNVDMGSSDFTLDPYLGIIVGNGEEQAEPRLTSLKDVPGVNLEADYGAASRTIVVMNRHTGEILWSRPAKYSFRHNTIVLGGGKLFCIDGMSRPKLDSLQRRGYAMSGEPTIYALDARTGDEIWSATKNVFGTWLGYSAEHGVLVQAGSRAGDRARDEPGRGIAVYDAANGDVLWNTDVEYSGPVMLRHDTLMTQAGGPAFDLRTGKRKTREHPLTGETIPWRFQRNYGCNTAIASEHLLTFRSAAAGYYDLAGDGGTGNFGGFRSSCTSNLIVANGILNAPDYTRTCTCSYQNQTSLAMVNDPDVEMWTFTAVDRGSAPVKRLGLNLGAPGDRLADGGTLWLDYPSVGGASPDVPVTTKPETPEFFRYHTSAIIKGELEWVVASGLTGLRSMTVTLAESPQAPRRYTVRLHFSETEYTRPGQRVFNIAIQGRPVLEGFDVIKEAGAAWVGIVKEFKGITASDTLEITTSPAVSKPESEPILCGIELIAEGQ